MKIQKKIVGGSGVDVIEELKGGRGGGEGVDGGRVSGGVRVDVNGELKFLGKFTKKWGGRVGLGGGRSGWM